LKPPCHYCECVGVSLDAIYAAVLRLIARMEQLQRGGKRIAKAYIGKILVSVELDQESHVIALSLDVVLASRLL